MQEEGGGLFLGYLVSVFVARSPGVYALGLESLPHTVKSLRGRLASQSTVVGDQSKCYYRHLDMP